MFDSVAGDAIMIVAIDISDKVMARKELEKEKDKVSLAVKAAELGTFDMDLIENTMLWNNRCRTLFGISHNNKVTYENDFVIGLHPEDRTGITNIIDNVLIKSVSNGNYDVEYRTVGVDDQKIGRVRAKGKAYFDDKPIPRI